MAEGGGLLNDPRSCRFNLPNNLQVGESHLKWGEYVSFGCICSPLCSPSLVQFLSSFFAVGSSAQSAWSRAIPFLSTGPYSHIWMAFDRIFKTLSEERVTLRPEFCIENYLNDPRVTPEDQLQTQLLVPIF